MGQKIKLYFMYPVSQSLPVGGIIKDKTGWEHRHEEQHHLPFPEMHTLDLLDQLTSSSNQSWRPQSFPWSPKYYQAYCQPDNRRKKTERPLHFEAKQKISISKLTGSLSRICIVEKAWQTVYPLYLIFFDVLSEEEKSNLLKHFYRKVYSLQLRFSRLYTLIQLIFTTSIYWQKSSTNL